MRGDSTTNQLLYITHLIRSTWASGNIAHGLFLDVAAAFEKVWHEGLAAKLQQNGVSESCLNLFKSYLSNRKQIVVVDGVKSQICDVKAGIPQGSRLGPLLFILYINDIKDGLESELLIFADDTTLIATGPDPAMTTAQINRDLAKIEVWATTWKVTFNSDKSKEVIFSKKLLFNSPPVVFNQNQIDRVTVHRHLGLYLTPTLDWATHVKQVCLRANRNIARSRKAALRNLISFGGVKLFY